MPSIPIHHPPPQPSPSPQPGLLPPLFATPSGLALLEIQGTINSQTDPSSSLSPETLAVGELSFPLYDPATQDAAKDTTWHKRVYLTIGRYQRMTGEMKKLPKPVAILRRRDVGRGVREDGMDVDGDGGMGSLTTTTATKPGEELEIVQVVYYKLLFAHRPEPVGTTGQKAV